MKNSSNRLIFPTFVCMEGSADKIFEVLKRYWGFTEFRPVQERIIRSAMAGRDTLALMPTGGGKSLTYQVPGLAQPGLCIVVTPLIALMKDQVDRLRARRIPAVAIHSGLSPRQIDIALDNCVYGDVQIPLCGSRTARHRSLPPARGAHEGLAAGPWTKPTASRSGATTSAPRTCASPNCAKNCRAFPCWRSRPRRPSSWPRTSCATCASPSRISCAAVSRAPNLSYSVRRTDDKKRAAAPAGPETFPVRASSTSARAKAPSRVADMLRRQGVTAAAYHGGMGHAERSLRQEEWSRAGRASWSPPTPSAWASTNPTCGSSPTTTMCDSLESYYQEAGRAGRDGVRSYALLLTSPDERRAHRKSVSSRNFRRLEKIKDIYERVCSYLQIGIRRRRRSFVSVQHPRLLAPASTSTPARCRARSNSCSRTAT